jgi:hypothetical protein
VVQFYYGDDGLDVMNVSYLKQHGFIAQNAAAAAAALDVASALAPGGGGLAAAPGAAGAAAARRARGKLARKAAKGDGSSAARLAESEPVMAK